MAFVNNLLVAVGVLSGLTGITDATFPELLPPVGGQFIAVVAIASALYAVARTWPRPVEHQFRSPNARVRVVVGDIWAQSGHIAVGFSTTFDTETPHIISPASLQGQLLERQYGNDRAALDSALQLELARLTPTRTFEASENKAGNQRVYELGSVAVISQVPTQLFFCMAYTEMSADCTTQATIDGIWHSLMQLWRAVDRRGNGNSVSIAVIGGGQARISQHFPAQDAIRLTILSFVFASRKQKVCNELNIVVRPQDLDGVDMLELRAFLRSLEATS